MTKDEFWQSFLEVTHQDKGIQYLECFHFELTEELANELLALVLSGKKQATSSSLLAYEMEGNRIPQVGDYSIVTDYEGNPFCVIETTAVTILPFDEITFDKCIREGEDQTLDSWQKGHRHFFIEDGKAQGYEFTEKMPVVFEDFQVVFKR
ncbi:MAG: ASCH domain-containing protein [Turicibacter sp.]